MVDFTANFDSDAEGFVYLDDTFGGTNQPLYASGNYSPTGGFTSGALRVQLGDVNNLNITNGMSGGWQRSFMVDSESTGTLSFRYNMSHLVRYDADEFTEVRVSIDGVEQPVVDHLDGGTYQDSTGWQQVEIDLGTLSAGNHTITIGGFNNKKTKSTEAGEILIDDVEVSTVANAAVQLFDSGDVFQGGFDTLEEAIAASSSGDRIEIIATTLAPVGQIVIEHDLTINGAGQDQTILQATADTTTSGDGRGWFLVHEGVNLNMSGLTLDGNGFKIWQGIRHQGSGSIDDVKFLDIAYQEPGEGGPHYAGTAVAVFGASSDIDIFDSRFEGIGRIGAQFFGPGVSANFSNNTYVGKGAGDHLDYALDINNGAFVQVFSNTVSENRGVASSDGSTSAAFLVTTFSGPGTDVTFGNNTTDNNTTGFAIGFNQNDTSTVTFSPGNTITNSEYGVNVNGNPTVNTPENVTGDSARFDYDGGDAQNEFGGAAQDDTFQGGLDDDTLLGREGGDTFVYNVGNDSSGPSDGDDFIDGGTTGVGPVDSDTDTLILEHEGLETVAVEITPDTKDDPGHINVTVPSTETNGGARLDVDNIEEIVVGDGTNAWNLTVSGDFSGTDLAPNTITLNGGPAGDVLDAEGLTSAHDIVAFGNGGNDFLEGGAGNDSLDGGSGLDTLQGNGGDDTIDGGSDNDIAAYSGDVSEYTVTLLLDGSLQIADNVADRDGTDTVRNVETLFFSSGSVATGPVLVFDDSGVFAGGFQSIQEGVDAAFNDYTVLVAPGTYTENVSILNKNISLLSVGGREVTTIEGFEAGVQGTIFLDGESDGTQIGAVGQGFTVVGFDGPTPAIERGAFYGRATSFPGHSNLTIEGNEFVANGESALTFEYNQHFDGVTIENNIFSGISFDPNLPIGFGDQFVVENVPRQLVVIGGGPSVTNTQNVFFLNNEITGTSGGVIPAGETFNDAGSPTFVTWDLPFGNTMVTIDVVGGEISGNHFTGTTDGPSASGLRVRGPNTEIADNHFDNTASGDTRGVFQTTFDGSFTGNSFTGAEGSDLFSGSAGPDQMTGTDGKDVFAGNFGDDTIDGGADIDTAVYQGLASDYSVVFGGGTSEAVLIDADFNGGTQSFAYSDDVFGTNQPVYASGTLDADGGPDSSGALRVQLGGVNNLNITNGMSGGWTRSFTVTDGGEGELTFSYNMSHLVRYDADEFTEVRVAVDGVQLPVVDHLDGGIYQDSTGWQTVTLDLGTLSAGEHTLTLGGFNNKKTKSTEAGEFLFDDVELTVTSAGSDTTVTDNNLANGDEGTDTLIDVENLFFVGEGPVQVFDASNQFVAGYANIQDAIDDASTEDGYKIVIGPGNYNESILVDKELTIAGVGDVVLNGDGLASNGITIAADNVYIDPLTVTGYTENGIVIDSAVSNLTLDGVTAVGNALGGLRLLGGAVVTNLAILASNLSGNGAGLAVDDNGILNGLTVSDSHFDNNQFAGWAIEHAGGSGSVNNVAASNSTFDNNEFAGISADTMTNALFTDVTAIFSEAAGTFPAFRFETHFEQSPLSSITFDGFTVRNETGDSQFAGFQFSSFHGSFESDGNAPPVTGISINNGTIDGFDTAVSTTAAPGEFSQNNVTLENIRNFESEQIGEGGPDTRNGDLFSNEDRDFLLGDESGVPGGNDTLNGGGGNDVLTGREGNDELNGGDGLDTAVFFGVASDYTVTFGLDGLPSSVADNNAAGGDEGTDTLSGVETIYFFFEDLVQVFDDGGNFVESYATIQAAVSDASTLAGYKVVIGSGTFDESVTVDKALTFVGVNVGTGLPTFTPTSGSAFVLSGDLGAGNTVGFHNLSFMDAPRSGIQLGTGVTLGSLEISDSHFEANIFNGIEVVNGAGLGNFDLRNSTFHANGEPALSSGDGDVLLFNYQGDAVIQDVSITGADRGNGPAENGIQFRSDDGIAPHGPLGTVLLENITIDGIYEKQPIAFFNYTDVSGLTMTGVEVTADSLGFNTSVNFDGIGGDIDASAFGLTFDQDPMSLQGDDGVNTITGGEGDEILRGFGDNDVLIGNGGEDFLDGGEGRDILTGGADADIFGLFDGAPNLALADVVTDFEDGLDQFLVGFGDFQDLEISSSGADAVIASGAEVLAVVTGAAGQVDPTDFQVVV